MANIFISYRRADSAPYAGRLYDRLRGHFGDDEVFMDLETIEAGAEFAKVVVEKARAAQVLIALIGPSWTTQRSPDGVRRLDDPDDLVVQEIATGLASGARVIPVLAGKASMPAASELPPRIAALAERNAIELTDHRFRDDVARLIKVIDRATPAGRRRRIVRFAVGGAIGLMAAVAVVAWFNRPVEPPPVATIAEPQPVITVPVAPAVAAPVAPGAMTWDGIKAMPVIYSESFDPATVLDVWKPEEPPRAPWTEELKGGRYCVTNASSDSGVHYVHVGLDKNDLTDAPVSARVQAEAKQPSSLAGAGLLYRFNAEARTYYAYVLSPTGEVTFWRRGKDGMSKLFSGPASRSSTGTPTTVGIAARGPRFFLFADDALLATVEDDALPGGRVGASAMSKGRYCFDDFTVRAAARQK